MTTAEICDNLKTIYDQEDDENKRRKAVELAFAIGTAIDSDGLRLDDVKKLLATTLHILTFRKPLQQIIAENLLRTIRYLPYRSGKHDEHPLHFTRDAKNKETSITEVLVSFAKEIYALQINRDAFAGKRRGYALDILGGLAEHTDVPEMFELCRDCLQSKSNKDFLNAIETLKCYYLETDKQPDEAIIDLVDKRIAKAKTRAEVVGGLDLQVQTGVIEEFEALSRLDTWKEENGY